MSRTASLAAAFFLMLAAPVLAEGPGHWSAKAPLIQPMDEIGGAVAGGRFYVVGGQTPSENHVAIVTEYDPVLDVWRERAPMPQGLSHPGVTSLGDAIYVFGGFMKPRHGRAQDVAFRYDTKTDRWRALPKLSSPRGAIAAVAIDGKLHIFGGRGLDGATVTTHEVLDPKTGRWSKAAPLPRARDHAGIAVLDGKIHVFGGRTADGGAYSIPDHDVYDPRTDSWSKAAPLPAGRSSGAYTVLDGRILYAGGECRPKDGLGGGQTFDDMAEYDAKTDRWIALAPLPGGLGRHAFAAGTIGHVAFFAAGAATCGDAYSTDLLTFTLP